MNTFYMTSYLKFPEILPNILPYHLVNNRYLQKSSMTEQHLQVDILLLQLLKDDLPQVYSF
jgi:hypothetical protein